MKKILTAVICLTFVMGFSAKAKVNIAEEGRIENFDNYSGNMTPPSGWSFASPGANFMNGASSVASADGKEGNGVMFRVISEYNIQMSQIFEEAYTDGIFTLHFDFKAMDDAHHATLYMGLLETDETLPDGVTTNYTYVAANDNYWGANIINTNAYDKYIILTPDDNKKYRVGYMKGSASDNLRSGTVTEQETPLEDEKWYTVDCIVDLENNSVSTYIDGIPVYENLRVGNGRDGYGIEGIIFGRQERGGAEPTNHSGIVIDNLVTRHSPSGNTVGTSVSKKTDVATDMQTMDISFTESILSEISAEDVTLVNLRTGEETQVTIEEKSSMGVTVGFVEALDYYTDYEFRFSENISTIGKRPIKPVSFRTAVSYGAIKYQIDESFDEGVDGFVKVKGGDDAFTIENGALKIKDESYMYKFFDEAITGLTNDTVITVEFDIEAPNGGFYINLLTKNTPTSFADYITSKKIFALETATAETANVKRSQNQSDNALTNAATNQAGTNVISYGNLNEKKHVVLEFYPRKSGNSYCKYTIGNEETKQDKYLNFRKSDIYDGVKITDIAGVGIGGFQNTGTPCTIDNFVVYEGTKEAPDASILPVVLGAEAEIYNGEITNDFVGITPFIKNVVFKFPCKMKDSVVDFVSSSAEGYTAELSEDKMSVVVDFTNGLEKNKEYQITVLNGAESVDGAVMEREYKLNLTTADEEKIVYSPIKLISEEVGVKASVECFNTTCEDEKLMLMLCQYSFTDGYKKAEKINFVPINVISGRTKVESTFTLNDKASEVECMLVKFPMHKIIEKIIYE